uniref:Ectonucleoside triphosphate diphosphohydrolase 2 n=1 Tax=Molossus molossus TaxID=27622 RepID=A0A7J8EDR8_MOLMO|nr:ectonucleoside triphosphate diphosphohydrolase 2 [Molossus molossus]
MAGQASGSSQERERWGPWTWEALPHRSPSRWPARLRIQITRSSCSSTASSTASTPTASSAMAATRSSRGCRPVHSRLFNSSSCPFSRCSFNGIFQPPVAGDFIAFSAFFYTVDFLRTVMGLPVATLQQLESAVVTVCNQTWTELQARAPGAGAHLPNYCAGAMFVQQLLSRGYHFDERAFSRLTFQKKAGDTAVGWALGYMLNLTNLIPADPPGLLKGINFGSWVVVLLLFAAILLAAVALLLRQARPAKSPSAV